MEYWLNRDAHIRVMFAAPARRWRRDEIMATRRISRSEDPLLNPEIEVGSFYVFISIRNPSNGTTVPLRALVDTGSTLTIAPAPLLRSIGLRPEFQSTFEYADGRQETLDVTNALVTVEGREVASPVVFAGDDVDPILGVVALEAAGLTIDPVILKLVPRTLLLK